MLALMLAAVPQVQAASPADDHDHDHGPSDSGGLVLDAAAIKANSAAPVPKQIRPEVASQVQKLLAAPQVRQALEQLKADESRFIQEAIQLTEIPAPTFAEAEKAKAFAALLRANGLKDVRIDAIGNVIGVRKGSGKGPTVAIIAHLDTVFPAGTDVKVTKRGNRLYGRGLTDDSAGLAMQLTWLRALDQARVRTVGDLVFVASVGEEGNGDLRGVKAFFKENPRVDGVVVIEGAPDGAAAILSTGSNRFQVDFKGPGGHSFVAYGQVPSAIHGIGRLITKIGDLKLPEIPKTTVNVGIVKGGRSVNTISPDATVEIDIRSNGRAELDAATKQVLQFVDQSVAEENQRWGKTSLSASIKQIGARPGGMTAPEQPIVHSWLAASSSLGIKPFILAGGSTDGGVPIYMGIPTIVLGFGGKTFGFHAMDESWIPTNAYKGVQVTFLSTLAMAGVAGVSQPTVAIR
jgi:acetylornithine deacetylase/succinyl-diaminopimelate desuccinylase-like protein